VDQYRCVLYMCVAFVEKAKLAWHFTQC
jgi:hypothetical protein